MSQPDLPNFDDLYEYYDPDLEPLAQRQQQVPTPLSQRRPLSSASSSVPSLRRTPRLQARNVGNRRTPPHSPPRVPTAQQRSRKPKVSSPPALPAVASRSPNLEPSFNSASTTPETYQRLVEEESFWPRRSSHISKRTHDAILFALEAIRKGRGVDAKPLSVDLLEEKARMSDLIRGNAPVGTAASSRSQNGGSRAAQGSGPTPADPPRYRTPTDVMRDRRAREARKAQEAAERQRKQEEEDRRKQEEEVVGVDTRRHTRTRPSSQNPQQGYDVGGSSAQPGISVGRRSENVPLASAQPDTRRSRTATFEQRQAQQEPAAPTNPTARPSSSTQRNRTEAYEALSAPTVTKAQTQPQAPLPQQNTSTQQSSKAGFPHAFERWETLSSHWEGLTSYWIRRLQENTNELSDKPIDQLLARQNTDLSAAGANLFHAVVELQRLRASSERKFQRWFFETRNEQEQAQERQAELERQLREERTARTQSSTSIEAAKAEKSKAEELVREMRRELQISKEEARRAWEELGRREQEERDRTIALRSGEPTVIGGVQVVPMQGMPSRQVSTAQRPVTRDGPYPGGPGSSVMGGQLSQPQRPPSRSQTTTTLNSPEDEQRQFSFRPSNTASPTSTDPFTETGRANEAPQLLRHEPDSQSYSGTPPRLTQPATSVAAISPYTATSTPSPARYNLPTTNGTSYRAYAQGNAPTALSPGPATSSTIHPPPRPNTAGTAGTERSYVPSIGSSLGEQEYHINPDGSYTRDSHGQRIPYGQDTSNPVQQRAHAPPQSSQSHELSDEHDDDDDYDTAADIERERMYMQRYGSGVQSQPQTQHQQTNTRGSGAPPSIPQGRMLAYEQVTAPADSPEPQPDYSGADYGSDDPAAPSAAGPVPQPPTTQGWTGMTPRHTHPTRLSDILEERSGMTSPSRMSYTSGDNGHGHAQVSGPGSVHSQAPYGSRR